MKRNRQTAKLSRTGVSPYQRHKKMPYHYSTAYYSWKSKVTGKARRANEAARG